MEQIQENVVEEASEPYVGQWNHLVSTTNWEKGRIIYEWREAMSEAEAPVADYSDEAWARRVGGVTGQHTGRLRRVFERFGETYDQFDGLYWSHFQAALDWDDAEMWLEGAIQNSWSVSKMRNTRWETLGKPEDAKPSEADVVAADLDEDFEPALREEPQDTITETISEVRGGGSKPAKEPANKKAAAAVADDSPDGASIYSDDREEETVPFVQPFASLAELPTDLADAFEGYKLAILRHKSDGWEQVSRDDVLGSLDALKELAMAPSEAGAAF